MNDNLEMLERKLDEAARAFSKMPVEDQVKNMNALSDLIEAHEELLRLRKAWVMLYFRLIALIVIFVLCISFLLWHRSM